jgi:hypothetical protein
MEQAYVYIDGIRLPTTADEVWTVARIDEVHRERYIEKILDDRRRVPYPVTQEMLDAVLVDLYIPPNEWYPLNILGLPNYSITMTGKLKKNQPDRIVKGTVHERGNVRHSLTNSDGHTQDYADRLVAKMFLGPPPTPSSIVKHKDDNLRNCRVANLKWGTKKKTVSPPPASTTVTTATKTLKTKPAVATSTSAPPAPPKRAPVLDDAVFSKLSASLARLKQDAANLPLVQTVKTTATPTAPEEMDATADPDKVWDDNSTPCAYQCVCCNSGEEQHSSEEQ